VSHAYRRADQISKSFGGEALSNERESTTDTRRSAISECHANIVPAEQRRGLDQSGLIAALS
jgi:hypothetical protein